MNKKFWVGFFAGIAASTIIFSATFILYVNGGAWNHVKNGSIIRTSELNQKTSNNIESNGSELQYHYSNDKKVLKIQTIIDKYYLNKVTEEQIAEGVYKGIMGSLDDPYSVYYTKDEYNSIKASTSGTYCGIGAVVTQNVNTGVITIVRPYEDSPSAKAGIKTGDILYKVNGEEVTGVDLTQVVTKLKGEAGTQVEVTVVREGEKDYLTFQVERASIEVPSIEYEMLEDNIGYIIVTEFDEVTAKQFKNALDDLEKQGIKGLIIDLRNNGGGVLSTAVDMLDRMVGNGLLVYTEDKNGVDQEYKAKSNESFDKPLVILVNKNSASASEVFSGAIQDYGIGKLVGTKTFGKGIVQSIISLDDESAVKLTTSKYYTPKGRNIHETGLEPDVKVELNEKAEKKITIKKEEDNQLQEGIKEIKKCF